MLNSEMMRIYIIGTGGVGGYFGGKLAHVGNDVTFLARGEFHKALKVKGLMVNSVDGSFTVNPVKTIETIDQISNPDLIFISVKTYDNEEISKKLASVVNENTYIITFQNGIENDIDLQKHIKGGKVFPGIALIVSAKGEVGVINQTGGPRRLIFGSRDNENDPKLKEILHLFTDAGIDAVLSDDIIRDLWKKYIFINAFAGFTAICRSPIGIIREDKFVYDMYKQCLRESINVAHKWDINLPETIYEDLVTLTDNTAPDSKSSLLIDIENDRRNEIETLNGTLVRLAEKVKVDVPINKTIYSAIKLLNSNNG